MKKMFLIIAIFAMFFGINAMAQTGGDLSIICGNGQSFIGDAGSEFESLTTIQSNTPAIGTDYTLNYACGSNFISFNPLTQPAVTTVSTSIGGADQATRWHPVSFRFAQNGAGNCTATISYDGIMKSCNFPYNIGNVQPPILPPNNNFVVAILAIFGIAFLGAYLLFGYKKGGS